MKTEKTEKNCNAEKGLVYNSGQNFEWVGFIFQDFLFMLKNTYECTMKNKLNARKKPHSLATFCRMQAMLGIPHSFQFSVSHILL